MRLSLHKTTVVGSILAVAVAGMLPLPAAAAQTTAHKKSVTSSAVHSSANSTPTSTRPSTTSSKTGGKTLGKASGKSFSRKSGKRVKGQAAPTPERINEIQSALAKNGAYDGLPSGKWDDSTVDAMKKFQSSHDLNPSGRLDAPTLQKLGLGSETAGVAPPTPPPNSRANRLLSSRSQKDNPDNQADQPEK
jgi:peptidoglycan hydrolase-like protein with peptidoglycan-binding domain